MNTRLKSALVKIGVPALLAGTIAIGAAAGLASHATAAPASPQVRQDFQDVSTDNPFFTYAHSLYSAGIISGYNCNPTVGSSEPCISPDNLPYYRPGALVTRLQMTKFVDAARHQPGVYIDTSADTLPFYSRSTAANGVGVKGESATGVGVYGKVTGGGANNPALLGENTGVGYGVYGKANSDGVYGEGLTTGNGVSGVSHSNNASGVYGSNQAGGYGVAGRSNGTGIRAAVFAENTNGSAGAYAGYFSGNTFTSGTHSAAASGIKIDDPLDPANKYLIQSNVVSPDMMSIYNGNITLDAKGDATVQLPAWFSSLNGDFRYQLTSVGAAAPNLFVAQTVKSGLFKISGGAPNSQVSWQVTGVRQDPFAVQNRAPVEQDKPAAERGSYINPGLYGKPDSDSVVNTQR